MTDPMEIVAMMCESYQTAVSANDAVAYGRQFTDDAIRVPPGGMPEFGPEEIASSEQQDYDLAHWTISSDPVEALLINDDWVFGVAEANIELVDNADGKTKRMIANKVWLINRQSNGEWKIKRAMWNYR